MILSETQAQEIAKNPTNSQFVTKGLTYESKLKLYTEPLFFEDVRNEKGYLYLIAELGRQIKKKKKLDRTKDFIQYPLPITSNTNDYTADINKVFEARNANFSHTYDNPNQAERGDVLIRNLGVRSYIEKTGKEVLKNKPNTFVVLDKDEKGQPYLVTVHNDKLLGYEVDKHNKLSYIVFVHSEEKDEQGNTYNNIAVYDSQTYFVFSKKSGNYSLVSSNAHNLGYCPAIAFLDVNLNSDNTLNKWNPYAASLSKLTTIALYDAYIDYASLYGVFPLVEVPQQRCSNPNCEDGFIEYQLPNKQEFGRKQCDACNNSIIGAGTTIELKTASSSDEKDARGVTRFISPDVTNIDYAQQQQAKRRDEVKRAVTGVSSVMEKEAVNPEQVMSVMEDRRKPLLFISNLLSKTHEWIIETSCRLIGVEVRAYANYGTEWFFLDQAQLQNLFKTAKEVGIGESELMEIYHLLMDTKYKNNPTKAKRVRIESDLNPALFYTLDECFSMHEKGVMTKEDLTIKANFVKYIKRFEREQGGLVEFGRDAIIQGTKTYEQKIETIYQEFIKYSKEDETTTETNTTEPPGL